MGSLWINILILVQYLPVIFYQINEKLKINSCDLKRLIRVYSKKIYNPIEKFNKKIFNSAFQDKIITLLSVSL